MTSPSDIALQWVTLPLNWPAVPTYDWRTAYPAEMPFALARWFIELVDQVIVNRRAGLPPPPMGDVTIHYGDRATGRAWTLLTGACFKHTGVIRVNPTDATARFVLVKNMHMTEGNAIMLEHIVKMEHKKPTLVIYRHPNYHVPTEEELRQLQTPTQARRSRRITLAPVRT